MNDIYNPADIGQQRGAGAKYGVPALPRDWLPEKPEEHVIQASGEWHLEMKRYIEDHDVLYFHLPHERSEEQSSQLSEPDDYALRLWYVSFRRAFQRLLRNKAYFYRYKSLPFKRYLSYSRPGYWRALDLTDPPNLHELEATFEKSLPMLEWEDNWDGEGSPRFERVTWERTREFVFKCAKEAWLNDNGLIEPPVIGPGPHGAIDILWRNEIRKLIVTIPSDAEEQATFYYENTSNESIEGTITLQDPASKAQLLLICMV